MSKRFSIFLAASIVIASTNSWQAAVCAEPTDAQSVHEQRMKKGIYEEVIIKAPPMVVWTSMQQQRITDPDSTSVKPTAQPNLVEQIFSFPTPFGSADCVLHLADKPAQRVDFSLVRSDDVKAFEGSWVLTPMEDGHSTKLALSSYVEPSHVPLPRLITNALISHKARKNLEMVKQIAEKQLAEKSPADKSM